MSKRPLGYGLTADTKRKIHGKYSAEAETEALIWIEDVLDEEGLFDDIQGPKAVQEKLKDGIILCRLINALSPGSVKKISTSKMAFHLMENIGNFLEACGKFGLNTVDLFQTSDLWDGQDMNQVITCLHALGRRAQSVEGYNGPILGPKESTGAPREFTEEQLNYGKAIIGLQMGSNKGATAAGINYGKPRQILD